MAPLTFRNEDEEAQSCLSTLRDGTREEKLVARDRLAAIFARRSLYEEAAELYEINIRVGVRTPEVFERLSEVYRRLGDHGSADASLAEARRRRTAAQSQPQADRATEQPPASPPAPRSPVRTSASAPPAQASAPPPPAPTSASPSPATAAPRVISFPGNSPPPEHAPPEHAPAIASSGSRLGPAAPDGPASAGAALSEQGATDPLPDISRAPYADAPHADTARLPLHQRVPDLTPLPAEKARRPGRSVPGPILVVSVVLFLIVLPVLLLALLVVNPVGLYLEGRPAGPLVDGAASEAPRLKIAPGMPATWYLQTGRSVSGLWATDGLDLTLTDAVPGVGQSVTLTSPRSQSWGETITIVERRGQGRANQETIVPATFASPATLPPAGTIMHGRIAGQITAPRLNESSQFTTSTQSVDLPIDLVVVSDLDMWLDRFWNALRMFFDDDRWLLVTIGAILVWCVLAGAAAILFRARQR